MNLRDSFIRPLPAILCIAFFTRLIVTAVAGWSSPLTGDEIQYNQLAENLIAGIGYVENTNPFFPGQSLYAWQAPAYPYLLAAVGALSGNLIIAAKVIQILLGTTTVYLTYRLASTVFSDYPAAIVGLIVALYPGLVTNTHLILSETLFIFLLVLAFNLLISPSAFVSPILSCIVFGLAILTRGIILYFAPIAAFWLAFKDGGASQSTRKRVVVGILFLGAILIPIVPWIARNYATFHQFVLLETKGGVNFWLGNSPYTPYEFIRNVWKVDTREPILSKLPVEEVARDRAGYALGIAYVSQQPEAFLARMPAKFADLYSFERNLLDVAQATRSTTGGWNSPLKLLADVTSLLVYVAVMVGALVGLCFAPDTKFKFLFVGFILYFTGVHVVVFGDGRFHLPLIPFYALYAGWAISSWQAVRPRLFSRRGLLAGTLCAVFVAVWVHEISAALIFLAM